MGIRLMICHPEVVAFAQFTEEADQNATSLIGNATVNVLA